jgi:hypothetical protein
MASSSTTSVPFPTFAAQPVIAQPDFLGFENTAVAGQVASTLAGLRGGGFAQDLLDANPFPGAAFQGSAFQGSAFQGTAVPGTAISPSIGFNSGFVNLPPNVGFGPTFDIKGVFDAANTDALFTPIP